MRESCNLLVINVKYWQYTQLKGGILAECCRTRTLRSRGGRGGAVGIVVEGIEAAVALDAVQGWIAHLDAGVTAAIAGERG